MDELKQQLMEKLSLDEGMSQKAIETVVGFLKDKLPDGMEGMLDAVMKGEVPDAGGLLDKAKGLFGG